MIKKGDKVKIKGYSQWYQVARVGSGSIFYFTLYDIDGCFFDSSIITEIKEY